MSTFQQMQSDLQLIVQANLINTDLGSLLNLVQRQEVEAYSWSFLKQVITVWSTIQNTAGTCSVTSGSPIVTGVATSFTAGMAGFFMRVGPTLANPVVIGSVQSATQLTLQEPWGGANLTGQGVSIFQVYYPVAPLIKVTRVRQIFLVEEVSRAVLDFMDPARIATGGNPSVYWADGIWNPALPSGTVLASSTPIWSIELWPIPNSTLPYLVEGTIGPIDMVNATDQPQLPSSVIENKALHYACSSIFASTGNPKWLQLATNYLAVYKEELEKAKVYDHEREVIKKLSESDQTTPGIDVFASHDLFAPTGY